MTEDQLKALLRDLPSVKAPADLEHRLERAIAQRGNTIPDLLGSLPMVAAHEDFDQRLADAINDRRRRVAPIPMPVGSRIGAFLAGAAGRLVTGTVAATGLVIMALSSGSIAPDPTATTGVTTAPVLIPLFEVPIRLLPSELPAPTTASPTSESPTNEPAGPVASAAPAPRTRSGAATTPSRLPATPHREPRVAAPSSRPADITVEREHLHAPHRVAPAPSASSASSRETPATVAQPNGLQSNAPAEQLDHPKQSIDSSTGVEETPSAPTVPNDVDTGGGAPKRDA